MVNVLSFEIISTLIETKVSVTMFLLFIFVHLVFLENSATKGLTLPDSDVT